MFKAICQTGGIVGFNQYIKFVGGDADMAAASRHIEHLLSIDPGAEHIALGADFDGCDQVTTGISGIQDYPKFADYLLESGLEQGMIDNIFWNNAMGVMKKCCM
jgi:membrane dipeptidase